MRDRIVQSVTVAWKALVSSAVAWLVARLATAGLTLDPEIVTALEVAAIGLGVGITNVVLNWLADVLARVPWLESVVRFLWPNPTYPDKSTA